MFGLLYQFVSLQRLFYFPRVDAGHGLANRVEAGLGEQLFHFVVGQETVYHLIGNVYFHLGA
jgi:hypothetical protein